MLTEKDLQQLRNDGMDEVADEIERLRIGYNRYETARLINPSLWADIYQANLLTGKPFDEIIDDLRPFVVSSV